MAAGNLVRVWSFDNATKEWSFFDPRPVFADFNTIQELVPGRAYWVKVEMDQTWVFKGKERTLAGGWNNIVW